jgi:hypothetical protein
VLFSLAIPWAAAWLCNLLLKALSESPVS